MHFKPIEWKRNRVRILDQRRLPTEVCYLECRNASEIAEAIRTMAIRGAPAIGVAAAMGIALAGQKMTSGKPEVFRKKIDKVCRLLAATRPTAINLFWAVDRMKRVLDASHSCADMKERLESEAIRIFEDDWEVNRRIGENGKVLIHDGDGILTHCNAGALATAGFGTALGVIYAAWAEGKRFRMYVDETRPLLQGARLTAWELAREKIPATLLTDNMAAWTMKKGRISLVIVGADRIARNGDTANKIGTYGLAVLSKWHHLPFYVAAPTSTIDPALASGTEIPIEERAPEEVTHFRGTRVTTKEIRVSNPAFDVTPHSLIRGIITEKGIARKPFGRNLKKMKD